MMSQDAAGSIRVEARERLLLIEIDRPEKRNGFTPQMFAQLAAAYTRLETDESLRCGLLHAKGAHFSAGLDLPAIAPLRKEGQPLIPNGLVDPYSLRDPIRTKPMVVALKGICFTVAIELMLAADIAVAADNCRFAQLEVKRGIMAACGAPFRMIERAGWGNAMKLLLTGDEFDAEEAFRLGFVQEIVPAGQEFMRAMAIAQSIALQAPLAVKATLAFARLASTNGSAAAQATASSTQQILYNTEDAREALLALAEKRTARFLGR
jgi:enoyl-CoA hydratase